MGAMVRPEPGADGFPARRPCRRAAVVVKHVKFNQIHFALLLGF